MTPRPLQPHHVSESVSDTQSAPPISNTPNTVHTMPPHHNTHLTPTSQWTVKELPVKTPDPICSNQNINAYDPPSRISPPDMYGDEYIHSQQPLQKATNYQTAHTGSNPDSDLEIDTHSYCIQPWPRGSDIRPLKEDIPLANVCVI